MATAKLDIDQSTILDNVDERQIEFTGEVDGDEYEFAVQYDVLEALTGEAPDDDAVSMFQRYIDPVTDASLAALSRDNGADMIVVSENDLD